MSVSQKRIPAAGALALGAVAMLALVSCGGGSGTGSAAGGDYSTMTLQIDGPVTSYDPALGATFQDTVVLLSMYDTLLARDADGTLIGGLASEWNLDGATAEFVIRDDVTCSDGEALTGEVVAASLNRYFDPETAAPFLTNVIGAGNTATATGDGQDVRIELAQPYGGLLQGLTIAYTGIVCSAGVADPSTLTTGSSGTGPYVADSQVAGATYTLTSREDYAWAPEFSDAPSGGERPSTLILNAVADENTRANLQTTGEVQVSGYTTDAWERVAEQEGWTKVVSQQSGTYLMFNQNEGHPTTDPEVRKAIAQAIDIERLNQVQSYGEGQLITNLGQPDFPCYDESLGDLYPEQDTAAASEVLKGLKLAVSGTTVLAGGDANSYLASALEEAGAEVSLQNLENSQWAAALFKPANDWDLTILVYANTTGSMLPASSFFSGPIPPNGQNLSGVVNAEADAILPLALTSTGDESCAAFSEYQTSLLENTNVLPLATAPVTMVLAPGVEAHILQGFVYPSTIRYTK